MNKLDIKGDKDFADFHSFVTCALIMYKILVFVAFLFYLVNFEAQGFQGLQPTLNVCPLDYFDGRDDFCYHVGTKEMSQSEAEKYCESKYGILSTVEIPLPKRLKNLLSQNAKLNGDRKWWVFDCYELELISMKKNKFNLNNIGVDCSEKRKPICEKLRN